MKRIEYILVGDYYIPNFQVQEDNRPIGKWGMLHRSYLRSCKPFLLNELMLDCKLHSYLVDLNEQATTRYDCIVKQMMVSEGVTEELKASDQMAWVRAMQSIANRSEEIVKHELIYV